jgi:hypothetical protein
MSSTNTVPEYDPERLRVIPAPQTDLIEQVRRVLKREALRVSWMMNV